jgi:YVTN family beta-propeller protein
MRLLPGVVLAITCLVAGQSYSQQYHLLREIHVGGTGGWDYIAVNTANHRIYLSHGMQVNVVDQKTGDSVGVIPNTEGVHGIAFAGEKGYTSNGRSNSVTVFDLKTNDTLTRIPSGQNPDAIMYEPFSKTIVTCNGRSQDLSFIDVAANKVVNTIAVGGKPETAVCDGAGNLWVNVEDKNEVVHVDLKAMKAAEHWKTGTGESPAGLAIDVKNHRLFVGCGDNKKLVVLNSDNGTVVQELPIGSGCDGVAFDAEAGDVFASNGEGTLTVIHADAPDTYSVTATVPTKPAARTLTVDQSSHRVYLPTAKVEQQPPAEGSTRPRRTVLPGTFEVLEVGK